MMLPNETPIRCVESLASEIYQKHGSRLGKFGGVTDETLVSHRDPASTIVRL